MLKRLHKESTTVYNETKKITDKKKIGMFIWLIVLTMVLLAIYRFMLTRYYFEIVMLVYMFLSTLCILSYVIYNRGFSRRGITVEMLPDIWSDEQKKEFIEDGKRRLEKSRWLLMFIFAFLFVFAFDAIELFVVPFLKDMIFN